MLHGDLMEPFELYLCDLFPMEALNHLKIFEVFNVLCVNEAIDIIIGIRLSGVEAPILPRYVEGVLRAEFLSKQLDHLHLVCLPRTLILMSKLDHQLLVSVPQ